MISHAISNQWISKWMKQEPMPASCNLGTSARLKDEWNLYHLCARKCNISLMQVPTKFHDFYGAIQPRFCFCNFGFQHYSHSQCHMWDLHHYDGPLLHWHNLNEYQDMETNRNEHRQLHFHCTTPGTAHVIFIHRNHKCKLTMHAGSIELFSPDRHSLESWYNIVGWNCFQ